MVGMRVLRVSKAAEACRRLAKGSRGPEREARKFGQTSADHHATLGHRHSVESDCLTAGAWGNKIAPFPILHRKHRCSLSCRAPVARLIPPCLPGPTPQTRSTIRRQYDEVDEAGRPRR